MKILLVGEAANHGARLSSMLAFEHEITTAPVPALGDESFVELADEADVVVSLRFPRLSRPAQRFRLLQVPGAGLDGIDVHSLPQGATVCNVFEHEIPIAEYVLMAMIHSASAFDDMRRAFSPGNWSASYRGRVLHREIHGQTIGLLGMGHIGRAIAQRARAFGMRVVAVQRSAADPQGLADVVLPPERLTEMLGQSDYVVIACPLTDVTRGMIGEAELNAMSASSILINISRAEMIGERALYQALLNREIAGAYLDVWYCYPSAAEPDVAPSTMPFHTLPNAICTPHSSAWTHGLIERRYRFVADNITRLRNGEPLRNLVHSPSHQETISQ
ncbi:MAG: NAD(P)-binding domain-containing protein [Rhizobiaceae bacterium]|nr:NAD(P)-binding domain-containing protein [Rhizobiaceae bacterium]